MTTPSRSKRHDTSQSGHSRTAIASSLGWTGAHPYCTGLPDAGDECGDGGLVRGCGVTGRAGSVMATQREKYERFRALHERPGAFVIPNPWNEGTTRILTALGFEALGTTSAGYAFAVGRRDSTAAVTRDEVLQNAAAIVGARARPFMLAVRADDFLYGRADLDDTIRRLDTFADAGADVLYAPG